MRQTPPNWRRAWQLHRSISGADSHGDPVRTYNMTTPDYVGVAGSESGVCWQIGSSESEVQQYGERQVSTASFVLYGDLEIAPFDRCVFGGGTWEVTAVNSWLNHRLVELKEVM
mgnify:FL=1